MNDRIRYIALCGVIALGLPAATVAVDHTNIDEDRPLDLEDAYAIAEGELAVEGGVGYRARKVDPDQGFLPIQLLYGFAANTHATLTTTFFTDPRTVDEETKSGDVQLAVLHNFNQETLWSPAFGFKVTTNIPAGVASSGVDYELKGIVTKTVGKRVGLHLNAVWNILNGNPPGTDDDFGKLILGASWAPRAPHDTRTVLLANAFVEEATTPGVEDTVGLGFGTRYQLNMQTVLDVGITTELSGPVDRSRVQLTAGVSYGF